MRLDQRINNTKPERKRIEPVNLICVCENFNKAIDMLCNSTDIIDEIYCNVADPVGGIIASLDFIDKYTPDLLEKKNIRTTLSLASNRVLIKTDFGFSFGWYINYKIENGKAKILNVNAIINILDGNNERVQDLLSNGWELDKKER